MRSILSATLAVSLASLIAAAPATAAHLKGAEVASQAHVSLAKARAVALGAHPGAIVDQELEREAGGSGLRYSFDIKAAGKTFEVGVDAKTGRVLENTTEGANPD